MLKRILKWLVMAIHNLPADELPILPEGTTFVGFYGIYLGFIRSLPEAEKGWMYRDIIASFLLATAVEHGRLAPHAAQAVSIALLAAEIRVADAPGFEALNGTEGEEDILRSFCLVARSGGEFSASLKDEVFAAVGAVVNTGLGAAPNIFFNPLIAAARAHFNCHFHRNAGGWVPHAGRITQFQIHAAELVATIARLVATVSCSREYRPQREPALECVKMGVVLESSMRPVEVVARLVSISRFLDITGPPETPSHRLWGKYPPGIGEDALAYALAKVLARFPPTEKLFMSAAMCANVAETAETAEPAEPAGPAKPAKPADPAELDEPDEPRRRKAPRQKRRAAQDAADVAPAAAYTPKRRKISKVPSKDLREAARNALVPSPHEVARAWSDVIRRALVLTARPGQAPAPVPGLGDRVYIDPEQGIRLGTETSKGCYSYLRGLATTVEALMARRETYYPLLVVLCVALQNTIETMLAYRSDHFTPQSRANYEALQVYVEMIQYVEERAPELKVARRLVTAHLRVASQTGLYVPGAVPLFDQSAFCEAATLEYAKVSTAYVELALTTAVRASGGAPGQRALAAAAALNLLAFSGAPHKFEAPDFGAAHTEGMKALELLNACDTLCAAAAAAAHNRVLAKFVAPARMSAVEIRIAAALACGAVSLVCEDSAAASNPRLLAPLSDILAAAALKCQCCVTPCLARAVASLAAGGAPAKASE